jgi:hypothetical protein
MIVWFVDRFGLPGHYYRIWHRLLVDNHVPVKDVRVVSLHAVMKRTLLQRHASRKAPTWVPDEMGNIITTMDSIIDHVKPKVVVISAPEALACIGIHPDSATLHNLRGSVYYRREVPHLVTLPMSAWTALVSQKEIGAANYGFESADEFKAARLEGAVSEGAVADSQTGTARLGGRTGAGAPGQHAIAGAKPYDSKANPPTADVHFGGGDNESGAGTVGDDGSTFQANRFGPQAGASVQLQSPVGGPADSIGYGAEGDDRVDGYDEDSAGDDEGDSESGVDVSGSDESSGDSDFVPDDSKGLVDNTEIDRDDPEIDQFFYEPVLSPVGRFVLTADVQKLFRILRDGKEASGPARPIKVDWR